MVWKMLLLMMVMNRRYDGTTGMNEVQYSTVLDYYVVGRLLLLGEIILIIIIQ